MGLERCAMPIWGLADRMEGAVSRRRNRDREEVGLPPRRTMTFRAKIVLAAFTAVLVGVAATSALTLALAGGRASPAALAGVSAAVGVAAGAIVSASVSTPRIRRLRALDDRAAHYALGDLA